MYVAPLNSTIVAAENTATLVMLILLPIRWRLPGYHVIVTSNALSLRQENETLTASRSSATNAAMHSRINIYEHNLEQNLSRVQSYLLHHRTQSRRFELGLTCLYPSSHFPLVKKMDDV